VNFAAKLTNAVHKNNSLLCIGLDPAQEKMPERVSMLDFNRSIIDATADLVCAYKLNFAFYEVLGEEGLSVLKLTREHIPGDIPAIGDAKRGDIGNTAKAYAKSIFDHFGFDAATVNPYLGFDSLEPFIQYRDRGIFILCRTSNSGAVDFQSLSVEADGSRQKLFEVVARKASQWNVHGNIGLVVGATYPEELKTIRQNYPDIPLLIPGIGAQGGNLALTIRCGVDGKSEKTIINSSRQIIYASPGKDFPQAAHEAAAELRAQINSHLSTRSKG
jgi:orotidine-5'-phosphate decarboxylase